MTTVMEMSTDADILATALDPAWNPIANRYAWAQVSGMNLNIPAAATIVVVAHGDGNEIGNAVPGTIDINAETFLALIQGNMNNAALGAIYISTCGPGIAEFAASVRIAAENNQIWNAASIFGHSDPMAGPVPPPNDIRWFEIFAG
jgi:hypothetical protein